ncbi:hypothetical protein FHX47_001232 [Garicola koreensis]|uniref:Uncharacterized protein n=2 Tax=Garicola koreensis TaxID=1262554 RepID=A0A7W5Y0W9_9MICC|nr:hypothetical protein [Garicola koreensis]
MTDAPFVRVDLYDTDEGPAFGEFTFSSGAEYKRTITYSEETLDYFDRLFADAQKTLSGEAVERPHTWSTLLQATDPDILASHPQISLAEYERYAYYLYNQGSLGGFRLAEAQQRLAQSGVDPEINRYLVDAHTAARRRVLAQNQPAQPRSHPQLTLPQAVRKVYRRLTR